MESIMFDIEKELAERIIADPEKYKDALHKEVINKLKMALEVRP